MDIKTHLTLLTPREIDILNALSKITEGHVSDISYQCHERYPSISIYTSLEDLVNWKYVQTSVSPNTHLSTFSTKCYRLTDTIKPYLPYYR